MKLGRYKLLEHAASAEVVVVTIDDRSLAEVGPAPWSGSRLAELLNRVDRAADLRSDYDRLGELLATATAKDAATIARERRLISAELVMLERPAERTKADELADRRRARSGSARSSAG